MMKIRWVLISLFLVTLVGNINAQETQNDSIKKKKKHNFINFRYRWGTVLPTNEFLAGDNAKGEPIDYYQAFALEYGRQTDGSQKWHHIFNFPYYGIGFYTADFFNSDELGYPNALYGFIGLPLKRWNRSSFGYELGFGLTYNWEPYDTYENPLNFAVGSYRTVYIDATLYYQYQLSKHFDLKGGFGFTHFSNGSTRQPNSGINLISPYIQVNYKFREQPDFIRKSIEKYEQNAELAMHIGLGARQLKYDTTKYEGLKDQYQDIAYPLVNISAAYLKQISWKNKFGAGVDISYDGSRNAEIRVKEDGTAEKTKEGSLSDKITLGVYGTYEFTIDRLSISSYLGAFVFRKEVPNQLPRLYQKFGFKYHFKNDMYSGILVRAHDFSVADFIEWNIGYRLKWY
ncbi:acyloxyacyl hydrolase [Labilibacter sediminis]|nr:acyloxyacyl hydrolase [Labilibacter sediminis]